MIGKLTLALLLVAAAIAVLPMETRAQAPISADYAAQLSFPTGITFSVTAESSADITEIFLRYRVDEITTVKVTAVVQPDFEPARRIRTAWTWQMKKSLRSLPPGARVHYSWRIQDAEGGRLETPWETIQFDDDRYSWNKLTEDDVTVFWYKGAPSFAQTLLASANSALERLAADAGAELETSVSAYVYASAGELRSATLYPPDWMGGTAFSDYGTIAFAGDEATLQQAKRFITHELAHLVTYQMTANPYSDIPRWLDEGLATYAEGSLRSDLAQAFNSAVSSDTLFSIQTISSNFPSDFDEARLSYGQSYSVVQFLIERYGADTMSGLLDIFREGATYDDALARAYGFDTAQLDSLWRQSLGLEPRQAPSSPHPEPTTAPFGCQPASGASGAAGGYALLVVLLLPPAALLIERRRRKR